MVAIASFAQRPSETGKFISHTESGILAGNPSNENNAPFIFHSSLNYAFHKNLSAGLGVGVEFLSETYLPVTANLLYQFGDKKVITPFIRLQAGYQVPLESNTFMLNNYYYYLSYSDYWPGYYPSTSTKLDSKGGFMANPSVGVIVYTKTGLGVSLSAGYRYQKIKYQDDKEYELDVEYNRLSLTLGIIF
ncbi:hypothetical protein FACS1894182_05280 [Bacteroidia bacterium]|nr:hypothetical protein FACS1894182_05280 [Bacteroidia bacterium]